MSKSTGKHMSRANREVIEDGIRKGDSARAIAKRIGFSPSSITREVKGHRSLRYPKKGSGLSASTKCAHYGDCQLSGKACKGCVTQFTTCKRCRTRICALQCPHFEFKSCPTTSKWPYVCPDSCSKKSGCGYPKSSYDAGDADAAYRKTLSESRTGACITQEELEHINKIVVPLSKQGQSMEAIWASHSEEMPICVRSAYNYQAKGIIGLASIDMPRKVRLLPKRQQKAYERDRVDRTGRKYEDFCALPASEQARVVQGDSVVGLQSNLRDILTLHVVAAKLQLYLLKEHGDPKATVGWLDMCETHLGSRQAFEKIFGILLVDRGVEFDDWEGMEASCLEPGKRRCRVFYCDPMRSNQKSQAERNHEQLRRILPKGRSDFDRLSIWDVAVCASHVNSYPLASLGGKCPLEVAKGIVPSGLLTALGVERVPVDEVILKPYLMRHAVKQ